MRKPYENKLTMYENVDSLLDNNAPIVATIAALGTKQADLKTAITNIKAKQQEQDTALAGKAQDKYDAAAGLIDSALGVAGAVYTFGRDSGDNALIEIGDVRRSDLTEVRDTELVTKTQTIHDTANGVVASLAPYGVTAVTLTGFAGLISDYNTALGARESATDRRGGAVGALGLLFRQTDTVLDGMDRLVEQLKVSEAQFHTEYHLARVIRDLGQLSHVRTGTVARGETKNLTSGDFTDTTDFVLKNRGAVAVLMFCTGTDGMSACAAGVAMNPGETRAALATTLGAAGNTFLNVTNMDGVNEGNYEVRW